MRKSLVLLVATALAMPHAAAATERPLAASGARAVTRLVSSRLDTKSVQAQQAVAPDTRGWVERHPVWSGMMAGAGVGAAWGALSCREPGDCFPINAGGAAIIGATWGAGIGAAVGWLIGAAVRE